MSSGYSVRRLLAWLPVLVWAGLIFLLSAQPDTTFKNLGLSGELFSVAAHLGLYAVLMLLLVLALQSGTNIPTAHVRRLAFLIVALYAFSDEFHQSFVPGRTATIFDWIIDLTGAALVWWALHRWQRRT